MKKTMIALAIFLAATSTTFAQVKQDTSHKSTHHKMAAKKYTCTMHPDVVMDKPGKCPKCGMDLVPMKTKTAKSKKAMGDMKM